MDIDSEEFLNEELDSDNSEDEDARLELEVTNLENQVFYFILFLSQYNPPKSYLVCF